MYDRLLGPLIRKTKQSILILGPRQVGKSTLVNNLKPDLAINLSDEKEFFLFLGSPEELQRRIEATQAESIFVDEIQRIPRLTNTIQFLIDKNPKLKFYLSGSSARKLKRGKANLLPGRVFSYQLSPLSILELGRDWDESLALKFGTLPGICTLSKIEEKKMLLRSYTNTYLKEEIQGEALVRRLDGFVKFLNASSLESGKFLDYSKLSKRAKIPRQSCVRFFEILEDTLICSKVDNDPIIESEFVDLIKHPRIFFFDLGVLNALRSSFELNQERIGFLFEHLVFNQITNTLTGKNLDFSIYNHRTRGGHEIDFIVKVENNYFAIECKSSESIQNNDLNNLHRLNPSIYSKIKKLIIYRGKNELKENNIWMLPLKKAIEVISGK